MKRCTVNGLKLELYDSAEQLPAWRYFLHARYVMIDAGIGSDLSAFDNRINGVIRMIKEQPKGATQELENLKQTVRFIVSNTSPEMYSFVCLVKTINGKEITQSDLSEEGLERLSKKISSKASIGWIRSLLKSIKKKVEVELEVFFKKLMRNPSEIQFYALLKRRALLVLEGFEKDNSGLIENVERQMVRMSRPSIFGGENGKEAKAVKNFESMCIALEKSNLMNNPRMATTVAFFQALEMLEQMIRKNKK